MTGMYHIYVHLDEDPVKGSPFDMQVITLRPDAAQCQVRGESLHRAVARRPQNFDVLFVDAIGHVAHAEELDVWVEPNHNPPPSWHETPAVSEAAEAATVTAEGITESSTEATQPSTTEAAAIAATGVAPSAVTGAISSVATNAATKTVAAETRGESTLTAGAQGASKRVTVRTPDHAGTGAGAGSQKESRASEVSAASDDKGTGGKLTPMEEEVAPVEPNGAAADTTAATETISGSAEPRPSSRSPRVKRLDAATRQRHLQLWTTRQASDKWMTRRSAETTFRESGYGGDDKKKMKKMAIGEQLPSFAHELSADKFGFAFGGVDPGTLHAHGKLIKVHHVSYSIGLAGYYKLHVSLRQQMRPLPGSPFDLRVDPGAAYAASTNLPSEREHLTKQADEEWQHGLLLTTADMLGNKCVKGGANVTLALPKRWATEQGHEESPVLCRVNDKGDGTYELEWSSTLAGTFPLDVCIDGSHVGGSPIDVTVLPARPDVNRFVASGAGLGKAVAGIEAPIRIRVADRFDNQADMAAASTVFGLILVPQDRATGVVSKTTKNEKKEGVEAPKKKGEEKTSRKSSGGKDGAFDAGSAKAVRETKQMLNYDTQDFLGDWVNGCYEIRYVAQQAGVLDLHLWCVVEEDGQREPLPGSPFSVHVSEGNASAVGSFVREAEASKQGSGIVAGEHVILRPQVHDQFGNPSSAPEGSLTAVLDSPGNQGEQLEQPKLRSGLGSYELTLEPLTAGQHQVHILLHGEEITGSPVAFYVSPATPNSQKCYLSRADPEPVPVNTPCDILLKTHDKYGNQLDRGGVRVDAKAAGIAASACTVEDHKDGTYTIRLTAGAPGEVKVTARIDSVEIKTFSVFFKKANQGTEEGGVLEMTEMQPGDAKMPNGDMESESDAPPFLAPFEDTAFATRVLPAEDPLPVEADDATMPTKEGKKTRRGDGKKTRRRGSEDAVTRGEAGAPASAEPTGGAEATASLLPKSGKKEKGARNKSVAKDSAPAPATEAPNTKEGKSKKIKGNKSSRKKTESAS
jgi:hypothetical protein